MMKALAKRIIKKILPAPENGLFNHQEALTKIINLRIAKKTRPTEAKPGASVIIFSKDRAIQLHALLASFFELVRGAGPVYVLYTGSSQAHLSAYEQVKQLFVGKTLSFYRETNFKADLESILSSVTTEKLFFLVDDIVFTEFVDIADFTKFDPDVFVPTLRMGKNLNYAYTVQQQQPLPPFEPSFTTNTDKIVWCWEKGELDWNYPLSVDGHLFDTEEISVLIKSLAYKAPNSLEHSLQQFNSIFLKRFGVAYQKSVMVNIPNNKVQTENSNIAGTISVNLLLNKWQDGFQIDYKKLRHFANYSAHQEIAIEYISRPVN